MLAGRRTSTERILTLFEGENIVSPPQNRRVCDGLVTALCSQLTSRNAVGKQGRRSGGFRVPKLARAERSADFQDRDGGILLAPLFGGTPFFEDAICGSGDQGSNSDRRLQISCPASRRRLRTPSARLTRASSCRDSNLHSHSLSSCQ
jgi:hypothetical protein